jgi:Cu(I)/Ag(I) efflux system membrane fusion protein
MMFSESDEDRPSETPPQDAFTNEDQVAKAAISAEARRNLTPLYDAYFEIQMALASDDLVSATKAYSAVKQRIGEVDMSLFDGDSHQFWMTLSERIARHADSGIDADNIEISRDAFFHLSNSVIELHRRFSHSGTQDYYLTYCPMARENSGAFWLQTVDTIYNSYFGASMLRCGEIRDTIQGIGI